jgi:hypothetical protein
MILPKSCTAIAARKTTLRSVFAHFGLPIANLLPLTKGLITEREKNVSVPALVENALVLIDCETEIVRMELKYPHRFVASAPLAPLAKWNGTIAELLELAVPIHFAGKLLKPSGEPMAYSDVISLIGNLFGIEIAKPYDRKTNLLSRKKGRTPFLDMLTAVYLAEVEKIYQ